MTATKEKETGVNIAGTLIIDERASFFASFLASFLSSSSVKFSRNLGTKSYKQVRQIASLTDIYVENLLLTSRTWFRPLFFRANIKAPTHPPTLLESCH